MKTRTRIFGIFFSVFLLLLAAAITLRTIAIANKEYFNYKYKYFTVNSLPLIANILITVTIIFFIIYIIGAVRELKLIPNFESPANYIPSAVVSAALFFMTIYLIKKCKNASDLSISTLLPLLLIIFAILSIVYFAYNTLFIRTVSARRAGFGLCIVIFLSLYLTSLYFDTTTSINSPIKTVDQLTYAFSAVFFLYEVRLSMGREKWKTYIIFGFIAAALAAYSSIPAIITFFIKKEVISSSIYESLLTFSLLIFISSKLILTDKLIERKESPLIKKLREAAERREAEMHPAKNPELSEEPTIAENLPDENQFSILDIAHDAEENSVTEETKETEETEIIDEDTTNFNIEENE